MSAPLTIDRTIFFATLVQDSALSICGIDTTSITDQPFTRVDGVPVISARGLKGAAVAMALRCFAQLPRSVSDVPEGKKALVRSAWRFEHARPISEPGELALRAGVGILQATGARAEGVLYDREIIPAGTRWKLELHVDWRLARAIDEDPEEAEGILGSVLGEQWAHGRCWLGGGVARGLGWCHLEQESLRAHRLTGEQYDSWLTSERRELPAPESQLPKRAPTRSWCFRTLELELPFGEHRPAVNAPAWGVDMLAISAHSIAATRQQVDESHWVLSRARPEGSKTLEPNRAILMEGGRPLLPGSSLRGPLRHAYSRQLRARGEDITDPHAVTSQLKGSVPVDSAMKLFGTLEQSSRLLIRDSLAEQDWLASRLHQHAEDELAGGSFASAKRDAVRLLAGTFKIQLFVEGPDETIVQPLLDELDRTIALGELGHLPLGGHKTRGAGWCRWRRATPQWQSQDITSSSPQPASLPPEDPGQKDSPREEEAGSPLGTGERLAKQHLLSEQRGNVVCAEPSSIEGISALTLGEAARRARAAMTGELSCWWCEPRIDLEVQPPVTFGRDWPGESSLIVDEVIFFGERESWRAVRTRAGWRAFLLRVIDDPEGRAVRRDLPATSHLAPQVRFSAALPPSFAITLHEWRLGAEVLGFTAKGSLR